MTPINWLKAAPWLLVIVLASLYVGARGRRVAAETVASTLSDTVAAQSADIEALTQANAEFEELAKQATAITEQAIADGKRALATAAAHAAQATARQREAEEALRAFERVTADPGCQALLDTPVCPALQER